MVTKFLFRADRWRSAKLCTARPRTGRRWVRAGTWGDRLGKPGAHPMQRATRRRPSRGLRRFRLAPAPGTRTAGGPGQPAARRRTERSVVAARDVVVVGASAGWVEALSLIHISEPTRRTPIS